MQRAKAFFFVSAGVCLLALAYHFGATSARAQAPGNPVVTGFTNGSNGGGVAITSNGDVYGTATAANYASWSHIGNVFAGGGPTPAKTESFGQVKARYR
jgi:hypothetical protein